MLIMQVGLATLSRNPTNPIRNTDGAQQTSTLASVGLRRKKRT
jgi:hypothetical protein